LIRTSRFDREYSYTEILYYADTRRVRVIYTDHFTLVILLSDILNRAYKSKVYTWHYFQYLALEKKRNLSVSIRVFLIYFGRTSAISVTSIFQTRMRFSVAIQSDTEVWLREDFIHLFILRMRVLQRNVPRVQLFHIETHFIESPLFISSLVLLRAKRYIFCEIVPHNILGDQLQILPVIQLPALFIVKHGFPMHTKHIHLFAQICAV